MVGTGCRVGSDEAKGDEGFVVGEDDVGAEVEVRVATEARVEAVEQALAGAGGEFGLGAAVGGHPAVGVDGDGDGRLDLYDVVDAMASTAHFLRETGWRPGAGYQPGEPNFAMIEAGNAATVYQQAIAIMAARIDG